MPVGSVLSQLMAVSLGAVVLAGCSGSGEGATGTGPLRLSSASASRQTGRADQPVGSSPVIRVLDPAGKAVPGVSVAFAVSGGGTVDPVTTTTASDGIARTTWRLGATGPQSVQATSPQIDGTVVTFRAAILPSTGYQIDLRLLTTATNAEWAAVLAAGRRISEVVVGDVPDVQLPGGVSCETVPLGGSVDDLLILLRVQPIDGAGGILGQAGWCVQRASSGLPAVGIMELDEADLRRLEAKGTLSSVLLHEMLHVVGFGTVWSYQARYPQPPLIAGEGTADSVFIGKQAVAQAKGWNAAPPGWDDIPVENCMDPPSLPCGSGTQDSHWRESVFEDELMTGWLSGTSQPLSRTTIGALADLGYEVDAEAADPFDLATAALRGEAVDAEEPGEYLGDDVLRLPVFDVR